MMKKGRTRILFFVLFFAGFVIALFYGNYRVEKHRKLMQNEIDKCNKKGEQLQRRYVEQKATSDRLQRLNVSLNGQKNTLQAELDKAKEEFLDIESRFKELKDLENEKSVQLTECKNSYDALSMELEGKLEEEKNLLTKTKKKHEDQIRALEKELDEKISEVRSLESRNENCANKNARLCIIADELLDRYENKGVMSSLLQKEPMTQIKKVELEELTNEYRENIERQKEKIRDR
jgi:hypothetical protein